MQLVDSKLKPIREKVFAGVPLSFEDGMTLYHSRDLHGVGALANWRREQLHGEAAFYNRNRHINYTNVCALSCKFCSFYRKRGEAGAYEMPVEQVVATAKKAHEDGATEVHIVGGLHPWLKFDYYTNFLSGIREACPDLHVKGFTAIEIVHLSRISRQSIPDVLRGLRDAGLGSLPGGGAEIFDDRVHDEAFKGKVREDKWFDVHRHAHDLGLFSNATMLYGHIEGVAERVNHLIKLREHQADSLRRMGLDPDAAPDDADLAAARDGDGPTCFNCVIPLSFIPENSELGGLPGPTGLADLRTLALARLMCQNISHIKAFWIMQGIGLSQVALDWGIDDLDGTVVWYDITKRQGGGGTQRQQLHVETIERLCREARREPVERDTVYRRIDRTVEVESSGELQPA
jgi:aminodeoxyfutalosine synthase